MFSAARPYLKRALSICAVLALSFASHEAAIGGVNWVGVPADPSVPMAFEDPNSWDALDYDPNIHDPPPTGPELEPPGSDSTWFVETVDDPNDVPLENDLSILWTVPRDGSNGTTNAKIGAFAVGGGNKHQIQTLLIQTDVTVTGLERLTNEFTDPNETIPDPTFGDIRAARREVRLGRQDYTPYYVPTTSGTLDGVPQIGAGTVNSNVPGYDEFPWGVVKHSSGHFFLEYELESDPNAEFPLPEPSNADIKLSGDKDYSAGSLWEISGDAEATFSSDVQVGTLTRRVSPGAVFRVRGSDVGPIRVGARFALFGGAAGWDTTERVDTGVAQVARLNRGKSIVEFVLDADGVTPIEISDTLSIGSNVTMANFDELILPGFLRIKLMEPTTAGTGTDQVVLFRSDRISSSISDAVLPTTSQTQQGIFYDPDRAGGPGQPHRPIVRDTNTTLPGDQYTKVFADYAGVQYSWDIIYTDDVLVAGDDVIVDSVVLTNLQITGGIQGDFDDANGLDLADLTALKNAIGSISEIQALENTQNVGNVNLSQPMFDLDGDGLISMGDLDLWVTHEGFLGSNYGDVDLDGDVDGADLNVIMAQYGINSGAGWDDGDTDMDGDVDGIDFLRWQRNFTGPGGLQSLAAVPEPASAWLMGIGLWALATRRRK